MKIPELLRSSRRKKNFTVRQMGAYLGVDPASLCRWETGAKYPRLQTVLQVADKLGYSFQEIVNAWMDDYRIRNKKTAL